MGYLRANVEIALARHRSGLDPALRPEFDNKVARRILSSFTAGHGRIIEGGRIDQALNGRGTEAYRDRLQLGGLHRILLEPEQGLQIPVRASMDTRLPWHGPVEVFRLDPKEAGTMKDIFSALDLKRDLGEQAIKEQAERVVRRSLVSSLGSIENFARGISNRSAILIKGADVQNLDLALLGISQICGESFTEKQEKAGLVQELRPKPSEACLQTSACYEVLQEAHTENAGMSNVPDWVGLACARNNERAQTILIDPYEVMYSMMADGQADLVAKLWEPGFWVRAPQSFGASPEDKIHGRALFSGDLSRPIVEIDFADMGPSSEEYRPAFEEFRSRCMEAAHNIVLEPGDIFIMRNTRSDGFYGHWACIHGKHAYEPHPDPAMQRLLYRVYIAERSAGTS